MWTLVGSVLAWLGACWLLSAHLRWPGLWLAAAVTTGLLKAHLVLRRAAQRVIERIRARGDGRCIGGFVSWRTWLFITLMMTAGYVLRHGLIPRAAVGFVYLAVGVALMTAAIRVWIAWGRA
jgi:hypothetical protein